eukprot:GHVS01081508.1.p1 GENE.GHVS01081508.1~~GHVS01081508.1.p1  ORF type:complete len:243 (+),score=26.32 GHVS01081508.1:636-1364(+)
MGLHSCIDGTCRTPGSVQDYQERLWTPIISAACSNKTRVRARSLSLQRRTKNKRGATDESEHQQRRPINGRARLLSLMSGRRTESIQPVLQPSLGRHSISQMMLSRRFVTEGGGRKALTLTRGSESSSSSSNQSVRSASPVASSIGGASRAWQGGETDSESHDYVREACGVVCVGRYDAGGGILAGKKDVLFVDEELSSRGIGDKQYLTYTHSASFSNIDWGSGSKSLYPFAPSSMEDIFHP